jgi:hypothetical protein
MLKKTSNYIKKFTAALLLLVLSFSNIISYPTIAYAATGSSSDPYILSIGTTMTKTLATGSTTYFSFKSKGQVDLSVTGNIAVSITVFDNNNNTLENLTTSSLSTTYALYSSCTYLVRITSRNSAATVNIKASLHRDSTTWSRGGVWNPGNSPNPTNGISGSICTAIIYVPKDNVAEIYTSVNEDAYLNTMDTALTLSMSSALTMISDKLGVTSLGAALLYNAGTMGLSINLVEMNLTSLKSAGGYNSTTGKYTNGIIWYKYIDVSTYTTYYTYSSWVSSTMYGESGYKGTFALN